MSELMFIHRAAALQTLMVLYHLYQLPHPNSLYPTILIPTIVRIRPCPHRVTPIAANRGRRMKRRVRAKKKKKSKQQRLDEKKKEINAELQGKSALRRFWVSVPKYNAFHLLLSLLCFWPIYYCWF